MYIFLLMLFPKTGAQLCSRDEETVTCIPCMEVCGRRQCELPCPRNCAPFDERGQCRKVCSQNCKNRACEFRGTRLLCSEGCAERRSGRMCNERCPMQCKSCNQFTLKCTSCYGGHYGDNCDTLPRAKIKTTPSNASSSNETLSTDIPITEEPLFLLTSRRPDRGFTRGSGGLARRNYTGTDFVSKHIYVYLFIGLLCLAIICGLFAAAYLAFFTIHCTCKSRNRKRVLYANMTSLETEEHEYQTIICDSREDHYLSTSHLFGNTDTGQEEMFRLIRELHVQPGCGQMYSRLNHQPTREPGTQLGICELEYYPSRCDSHSGQYITPVGDVAGEDVPITDVACDVISKSRSKSLQRNTNHSSYDTHYKRLSDPVLITGPKWMEVTKIKSSISTPSLHYI